VERLVDTRVDVQSCPFPTVILLVLLLLYGCRIREHGAFDVASAPMQARDDDSSCR